MLGSSQQGQTVHLHQTAGRVLAHLPGGGLAGVWMMGRGSGQAGEQIGAGLWRKGGCRDHPGAVAGLEDRGRSGWSQARFEAGRAGALLAPGDNHGVLLLPGLVTERLLVVAHGADGLVTLCGLRPPPRFERVAL